MEIGAKTVILLVFLALMENHAIHVHLINISILFAKIVLQHTDPYAEPVQPLNVLRVETIVPLCYLLVILLLVLSNTTNRV